MPAFSARKLERGGVETKHTNNMLAVRWMDRREVCMLSTLHTDAMKATGKTDEKNNPINKTRMCVTIQ